LSAASYLRAAKLETRVFGEPMAFWERQMPAGMLLRSSWSASHISDPQQKLTLDRYRAFSGNHLGAPVPLEHFVQYGQWFQKRVAPDVDLRKIVEVDTNGSGFRVTLSDGEVFHSRRVVVAAGIHGFAWQPAEFAGLPDCLASHSTAHRSLREFRGKSVAVIGGGQSALESAALLQEAGAKQEVIARRTALNWVGLHSWLHHLGPISQALYSKNDVGPAGLSRLVSTPNLFKKFPRDFQKRASYRAIRPAGSSWLKPRLAGVQITLGRKVTTARVEGGHLRLRLDDGTERVVDHALLATGFKVDVTRYPFLSARVKDRLKAVEGYPVLGRGLESSVSGLHFLGKPASWSFGPLLCFVSGTEFASRELLPVARGD
jgi:hypothetical protein